MKLKEKQNLNASEKDNNKAVKELSTDIKTFKNPKNNSLRFRYAYKSPVLKAENIIVLDPREDNQPSNGKIPVYKVL